MKKTVSLVLAFVLLATLLAGCGTKTPDNSADEKPKVVILANAGWGDDAYANVIRDQLEKAGFAPSISLQPDYASWRSQVDAGNFDLAITYWVTTNGSPDYAVRGVFRSDGDFNLYGINDPKLDEYIDTAAKQTPAEYMQTYSDLEDYMVSEMAYVLPIYVSMRTETFNTDVLNADTVRMPKSRALVWEELRFKNPDDNATRTYVTSQLYSDLLPLDPIRSDDSSTFLGITNGYIRLLNLADDDTLTTKSSLTRGYTLAENGTDFYFLLRDDVHFCKVENMHAVDTGEIVSAEDVVYSVERMMDKNAAPDNVNYGNFETVDSVAAITDLESLKGIQTKDGGSVYDELQKSAPSDITALTDKATDVNNASGTYQVIRLSTKYVFPQALNAFAHNAGGIVSKKQIEAVNKKFLTDPASYDVKTDMLYGDQMWYTEGAAYDNNMVCSGPYIPIKRTDYGMTFEANPYYMPTEDKYTPKIKTIEVKFISDMENAFAALRAGEIHALYCMPAEKIALANKEANLMTKEVASNAYNYCAFNFKGIFSDVNLRKAAQFAVNQEQISAVFDNRLIPTYSPLTPVLGTGKTIVADAEKSAAYLNAWREARQ